MEEKDLQQTSVSGDQVEDSTPDYLAAIKELKQNSVDRSKYEELRAENKRLIEEVINGQPSQEVAQAVVYTDKEIAELRNELFNSKKDLTNLEYITKALELRDALIENGKPDPFLPIGKQITPTNEDIEGAERVAQVYKECIEYAQGDSEAFTNELMRRTRDVKIPRR